MKRSTTRIAAPTIVIAGVAAVTFTTVPIDGIPSGEPLASSQASLSAGPSLAPTDGPATDTPAALPIGLLRVDFTFERQPRPASNQFAIWIETADGRYVDTVFATSWIAEGGWTKRPMSMPAWRESSSWVEATRAQIESASRPAPGTGIHSVYWDGLDSLGQPVLDGEYVLRAEGNVEWERMVAFEAPFTVGAKALTSAATQTKNDQPQDAMLSEIGIAWLPGEKMTAETTTEYTRGS